MTDRLTCYEDTIQRDLLDRQAFTFRHKLLGHPALTLENLGRMIPTLPKEQLHYSSGKLERTDNFEHADKTHRNGMSIEETIETIRTSNSYIMIRSPQTDASFSPLFRELMRDIELLMRERNVGTKAHEPTFYLFISSPNSITPFHIDRYSNVLMQFQGTKELNVYPQWDDRSVPHEVREGVVARSGAFAKWRDEAEPLGRRFHLEPGDALHIPFVAGHHVKNGPDVSISLSLFFNTDETLRLTQAMLLNHNLRRRLKLRPAAVGQAPLRDALKSRVWQGGKRVANVLGVGR